MRCTKCHQLLAAALGNDTTPIVELPLVRARICGDFGDAMATQRTLHAVVRTHRTVASEPATEISRLIRTSSSRAVEARDVKECWLNENLITTSCLFLGNSLCRRERVVFGNSERKHHMPTRTWLAADGEGVFHFFFLLFSGAVLLLSPHSHDTTFSSLPSSRQLFIAAVAAFIIIENNSLSDFDIHDRPTK